MSLKGNSAMTGLMPHSGRIDNANKGEKDEAVQLCSEIVFAHTSGPCNAAGDRAVDES
jgi:hypothetical protein